MVNLDPLKRLLRNPGYDEEYLKKTLKDLKEHEGIFYVALVGDMAIGFACGIVEKQSPEVLLDVIPSKPGRITELYVDKKYRNKGIATTLMKKVEEYLKNKGCAVASVEVFAPNINAKKLYESLGYVPRDINNMKKL